MLPNDLIRRDVFMIFRILICCLLCLSGPASADNRGAEIIDKLQDKFGDLKTLSARFVRKHYWRIMDQHSEMDGRLYVQRPKRFRFETKIQMVVTDGEKVWNYAPKNEQVLISDYNTVEKNRSDEKLLFDLILLGGYAQTYLPAHKGDERVDGKNCYVVELTAKLSDTYIPTILLWIDKRVWVVRQVEYRFLNGDVTTFELSDLKVDKKISEDKFQFVVPKNIEAVDLR